MTLRHLSGASEWGFNGRECVRYQTLWLAEELKVADYGLTPVPSRHFAGDFPFLLYGNHLNADLISIQFRNRFRRLLFIYLPAGLQGHKNFSSQVRLVDSLTYPYPDVVFICARGHRRHSYIAPHTCPYSNWTPRSSLWLLK